MTLQDTAGSQSLQPDDVVDCTVLVHANDDWRAATLEQWHRDGSGELWALVSWRYAEGERIAVRVPKLRVWTVD